jgi:hypothetical protein
MRHLLASQLPPLHVPEKFLPSHLALFPCKLNAGKADLRAWLDVVVHVA